MIGRTIFWLSIGGIIYAMLALPEPLPILNKWVFLFCLILLIFALARNKERIDIVFSIGALINLCVWYLIQITAGATYQFASKFTFIHGIDLKLIQKLIYIPFILSAFLSYLLVYRVTTLFRKHTIRLQIGRQNEVVGKPRKQKGMIYFNLGKEVKRF